MKTTHKNQLTASELSHLWTSYQNDSMAICGIKYFLANIEDDSIREVLEYALEISKRHVQEVTTILEAEGYPIPQGFTEEDINLDAPRLFSDVLYLHYISNMGKFGLSSYSIALSTVARDDIINYYSTALSETTKLHNLAKRLAKEKGIYLRPPVLPNPSQVDFVEEQSFLAGYFGDRRPLLGIEITNLVYNAKRNALGQALIQGFGQVAKHKEVRKYFDRCREVSGKHVDVFGTILNENYLSQGVVNLTAEVTDSKVTPFSDKLMMYHIAALVGSGIGQYGIALSTSPRHDLAVMYTRLMSELTHLSDDGANIMIKHGWMEQPPKAADRKKLTKK